MHSCSSNQEVDSMQDDANQDDFKTLGQQKRLKPKIPRSSIQKKEDMIISDNDNNMNLRSLRECEATIETNTTVQITEVINRKKTMPGGLGNAVSGLKVGLTPKMINMSYDPFVKPKKPPRGRPRNSQNNTHTHDSSFLP